MWFCSGSGRSSDRKSSLIIAFLGPLPFLVPRRGDASAAVSLFAELFALAGQFFSNTRPSAADFSVAHEKDASNVCIRPLGIFDYQKQDVAESSWLNRFD